jgi:hypothetical protein
LGILDLAHTRLLVNHQRHGFNQRFDTSQLKKMENPDGCVWVEPLCGSLEIRARSLIPQGVQDHDARTVQIPRVVWEKLSGERASPFPLRCTRSRTNL